MTHTHKHRAAQVDGMRDLPDDGGAEEALKITAARELKAWNEFFRYGCPADDMAALKDRHGESTSCEIRGGRQSVMATSDY